MKNENKIATTIKVEQGLYDDLKILRVRHKFTLQTFAEKCIFLYIHDPTFREKINNFDVPILNLTGSL